MSDLHDWQEDGRAYCHQEGGYYITLFKRQIKVYVDKKNATGPSVNDRDTMSRCWGEMLKQEYKLVNPKTGVEKPMPHRDHFLVTPETNCEPW